MCVRVSFTLRSCLMIRSTVRTCARLFFELTWDRGEGEGARQPATSIASPVQSCSNCMQHVIMDIEGGRRVVLIINPADTLAFKSPLAVRASDEISATAGVDGRDWSASEWAVYGCQSVDRQRVPVLALVPAGCVPFCDTSIAFDRCSVSLPSLQLAVRRANTGISVSSRCRGRRWNERMVIVSHRRRRSTWVAVSSTHTCTAQQILTVETVQILRHQSI